MIFKIYKLKPVFNQVVVTKDIYTAEEAQQFGIYTAKENKIKEFQKVLDVGPSVRGIEIGDIVKINPARYVDIVHRQGKKDLENNIIKDDMHATVSIPSETIYEKHPDGTESSYNVMLIYDNDVSFVVKEGEYFNEMPVIIDTHPLITK